MLNLRAGLRYRAGAFELEPLVRLDNATDRKYAGSVIVNEANKRVQPGTRLRVTSDIVPVAKAGGRSKRANATRGATRAAKPSVKQTAGKPQPAKKTASKSQRAG